MCLRPRQGERAGAEHPLCAGLRRAGPSPSSLGAMGLARLWPQAEGAWGPTGPRLRRWLWAPLGPRPAHSHSGSVGSLPAPCPSPEPRAPRTLPIATAAVGASWGRREVKQGSWGRGLGPGDPRLPPGRALRLTGGQAQLGPGHWPGQARRGEGGASGKLRGAGGGSPFRGLVPDSRC